MTCACCSFCHAGGERFYRYGACAGCGEFRFCQVVFGMCYLLRWERCPYYDKTSPDGRFRVEAYGNFFYCFIPCAPGQGGDRPAMVKLIEVETGRMLAKAHVDRLVLVHDTFWYTNSVEITRGDYGHTFELPPPQ